MSGVRVASRNIGRGLAAAFTAGAAPAPPAAAAAAPIQPTTHARRAWVPAPDSLVPFLREPRSVRDRVGVAAAVAACRRVLGAAPTPGTVGSDGRPTVCVQAPFDTTATGMNTRLHEMWLRGGIAPPDAVLLTALDANIACGDIRTALALLRRMGDECRGSALTAPSPAPCGASTAGLPMAGGAESSHTVALRVLERLTALVWSIEREAMQSLPATDMLVAQLRAYTAATRFTAGDAEASTSSPVPAAATGGSVDASVSEAEIVDAIIDEAAPLLRVQQEVNAAAATHAAQRAALLSAHATVAEAALQPDHPASGALTNGGLCGVWRQTLLDTVAALSACGVFPQTFEDLELPAVVRRFDGRNAANDADEGLSGLGQSLENDAAVASRLADAAALLAARTELLAQCVAAAAALNVLTSTTSSIAVVGAWRALSPFASPTTHGDKAGRVFVLPALDLFARGAAAVTSAAKTAASPGSVSATAIETAAAAALTATHRTIDVVANLAVTEDDAADALAALRWRRAGVPAASPPPLLVHASCTAGIARALQGPLFPFLSPIVAATRALSAASRMLTASAAATATPEGTFDAVVGSAPLADGDVTCLPMAFSAASAVAYRAWRDGGAHGPVACLPALRSRVHTALAAASAGCSGDGRRDVETAITAIEGACAIKCATWRVLSADATANDFGALLTLPCPGVESGSAFDGLLFAAYAAAVLRAAPTGALALGPDAHAALDRAVAPIDDADVLLPLEASLRLQLMAQMAERGLLTAAALEQCAAAIVASNVFPHIEPSAVAAVFTAARRVGAVALCARLRGRMHELYDPVRLI